MKITAKMVKELRDNTGVGMMDAKKALVKADGDMEKALTVLKEKGLAASAKKEGRIAAEGLVGVATTDNNKKVTMLEVNCETDFVAKNEKFKTFVNEIAEVVNTTDVKDVDTLLTLTKDEQTIEQLQSMMVATIGEKISIRRFNTLTGDYVHPYVHSTGKVSALVSFKVADEALLSNDQFKAFAKNITMHVASMNPTQLSYKEFDPDYIEKETKAVIAKVKKDNEELKRLGKHLKNVPQFISRLQLTDEALAKVEEEIKAELKAQGKPEKIWDKIVPGKITRFIADNTLHDQELCLLDQFYVLDDKKTVAQAIEEANKKLGSFEILSFSRFEVGEGMEKRVEDFAKEVADQMK